MPRPMRPTTNPAARKLRAALARSGLTQAQFAARLPRAPITERQLRNWLAGTTPVPPTIRRWLAAVSSPDLEP